MKRMKIAKGIALGVIVVITGCVAVSACDEEVTPLHTDGPSTSVKRPSQNSIKQPRKRPRFARWLATAKIDFRKDEGGAAIYRLDLETPDAMTAEQQSYISSTYFRQRAAESFAAVNALQPNQVAVAVLSEHMDSKAYHGEAIACGICDVSLAYEAVARKGTLSMKIRNGDFDGTRNLIKEKIEAIVRDKNIRLVTGVAPPPGHYYIRNETTKEGNVLEVEFEAE